VTLSGLDQLCHAHRDRPPVDYYRRTIFRNVANLSDQMVDRFGSALVIVTADHGILWREQLEPELVVASDLFGEDKASPRYIVGARRRGYGRVCLSQGRDHTLFAVPYMTRRFRVNEWGVHGGLSAWESLVPLIVREHR